MTLFVAQELDSYDRLEIHLSQVSRVLSKGSFGKRTFVILGCWFVDDSAVFQASEIEHSHTTISSTTDEYIYAVGTESDVKDLFVMCNELGLSC